MSSAAEPMTTWRKDLEGEMRLHGESFSDVVATAPEGDEWMHVAFYDGYGGVHGIPFTVWTATRVYFPACYDGSEWVESVARNPDGKATHHVGGG